MTVTLRYNQIEAADAVEEAFRAGIRKPLVDSCVGSGKSLTMAELARRGVERGERTIICSHTRELVEQNANACRLLGIKTGINAEALGERTWRAPVISASIQSVFRSAQSFGPIANLWVDECDLVPHSEAGMYRQLDRDLGLPRMAGFSGTVFRLNGGSLVEGEGAPFDKVAYRYSIMDGIRDGILVPPYSLPTDDNIDPSKLRVRQGEYTPASQDDQMIALMDKHIAQMVHHGARRRAWLVFEASTKAAKLMAARLNEWGIPTGLILGETPAGERAATIAAYRAGRLRCLVNVATLVAGFDVQEVDMLVMRFKTKSLRKFIQVVGRLLRTIGGNIEESIRRGKADGLLLDYGNNVADHGPIDFLRPKETKASLVSCDACGNRNPVAARNCWSCDEPMMKLCPACLEPVQKGTLDCPHCQHDMRVAGGEPRKAAALLETPSGAALIAAYKTGAERLGGWLPIRKAWEKDGGSWVLTVNGDAFQLPEVLAAHAIDARWIRVSEGALAGLLVPNGASRNSVRQYSTSGDFLIVPMPGVVEVAA